MKRILMLIALLSPLCAGAAKVTPPDIVPVPQKLEMTKGTFKLKGVSINCDPALEARTVKAVRQFADRLSLVSGKTSSVASPVGLTRTVESGKIKGLYFIKDASVAPEGYKISIGRKAIVVRASDYNGFFYSLQTLRQMLPVSIYGTAPDLNGNWRLPCCEIEDAPRFGYRGILLDCCRHFFSVDEVKKVLDVMSMFKMNRFHWHLTEDQGWRIEIKKYPRLTEIGAWRDGTCIGKDFSTSDGIRYGGYYTQEQLREVVAYAAERGITVIPEIDLPGHMLAALASYPELGCTGGPYAVWQRWGITNDILCAGNEKVYEFLEDVLTEIIDIFPSEYIHIGGDECFLSQLDDPWDKCPKCIAKMEELGIQRGPQEKHYLQNYVTARVQNFLLSKGRKIIGWDEILEGDLAPGATVMSWRGTAGGIKAAAMGFDAIMTPYTYLYFDYYQTGEREKEPLCIGGNLPIETVYGYEPLDGISAGAEKHILGVQANLWTEYIATPEHLEYMLLPRMCALSEIQWTPRDKKDWDRFDSSLDHLFSIFDSLGYTYCRAVRGVVGLDK